MPFVRFGWWVEGMKVAENVLKKSQGENCENGKIWQVGKYGGADG